MEGYFGLTDRRISEINVTSSEVVENSQPEYPNGKCAFHLLFLIVPDLSACFRPSGNVRGNGTCWHPMEISIRGFDASHLLPLSTNRFFRLDGKQPVSFSYFSISSSFHVSLYCNGQQYCDYVVSPHLYFNKKCAHLRRDGLYKAKLLLMPLFFFSATGRSCVTTATWAIPGQYSTGACNVDTENNFRISFLIQKDEKCG